MLLQGWIQGPVAAEMFKRAGYDLATLRRQARTAAFKPVELKATLFRRHAEVELKRITSRNVIGKLTGSKYPNETVSYGGHWDAYGIGPADAQGRTIRPGAADDAVGLAAMIEIARQFAAGPRPERTLLFAAWTAEERGLLGSEYYAQHPLYPHETMVANLTLDTLQSAGPVKDVVLIGKGQSEMETLLADAAAAQGRYDHAGRPSRSAGSSIAPTISRSPSAACRCYSTWRWPEPTTSRTAGARRANAGSTTSPPTATTRPATPGRRTGTWRRGAGGGPVLRNRRAAREQPRMAEMARRRPNSRRCGRKAWSDAANLYSRA